MSLEIAKDVLEKACKEMIETILFCLPNAFRGTVYRVGNAPELLTERVTSGFIDEQRKNITWGLPEKSEYNPPGKLWADYRDEPGRPLEAMAWCVERQKSWTAGDPKSDSRSVRLQVEGQGEDSFHMEPVLVRKSDLTTDLNPSLDYATDYQGNEIWRDSLYVVVAVIKIHFLSDTIRIGSPETVVIKKLSRSLGTELLSYHLRQGSLKAMQQLARDRINACNILADSLRNAITKGALVYSLVKQETGFLRDQWEELLLRARNQMNPKVQAVENLNRILLGMDGQDSELGQDLVAVQKRFLELALPPEKAENWVVMQIEERWKTLLGKISVEEETKKSILKAIEDLKVALHFGQDSEILTAFTSMPEDFKKEWVELIYSSSDRFDEKELDRLITLLADPVLQIPSREKSRKRLVQLKALAQTLGQLEQNTNFLLRHVLNGGGNGFPECSRL
ncbi:MAG: hypothetical protein JXL84_22830 [Deltaproteobacteria bacterium]|nr:hypothetical protein [Deltaproteobacteria bacterium]